MIRSNLFTQRTVVRVASILTSAKVSVIAVAAATIITMPLAANAGDAENGEKLAGPDGKGCAACHQIDGNSVTPTFPILAGQYEDYLVHALKQYRSGERQNAIMGASANLTDEEIEDLAAWFSSQESVLQYVK